MEPKHLRLKNSHLRPRHGRVIFEDRRCLVSAIKVRESVAKVDRERCIACGLRVTRCNAEAVHLVTCRDPPDPLKTIVEMGPKIAAEKGKQDDFIKIMGR
jgi:uncharacterized Fe-S center protein